MARLTAIFTILVLLISSVTCDARGGGGRGGMSHGYRPARGISFAPYFGYGGYYPYGGYPYGYDSSLATPPEPTSSVSPQAYDLTPLASRAAVADAEYERAYADLQSTIRQAREAFDNSPAFLAAQIELADAHQYYDAASVTALDQVHQNPEYRQLIERRTEAQIALKSAPLYSGRRERLATLKMESGAAATKMEGAALDNDATYQQAKGRLVAARHAMTAMKRQFQASLENRPDVAAARRTLQAAAARRAAADAAWQAAQNANTTFGSPGIVPF